MDLEYVDIFYSHRFDPETPLEETMGALASAVRSGKALYVGISNYDPQQTLLAKQISDFNILTIKFSPVETDKLVSCGKENIRFWRVKNQHLPGSPVILNHHARNTVFTVLDF